MTDTTHKLIYLTTNPHKVEEANRFFKDQYGFEVEIMNPNFEILEIQADTADQIAKFSAKFAAKKLKHACLVSDTALYLDCLGGLPGPYNAYFDKQIGTEKFLTMIKEQTNRKASLQHAFAYCEPNKEPILFDGGSKGTITNTPKGKLGRWHDQFFIPEGETKTLSELREQDPIYESKFWGNALHDFATWYRQTILRKHI